MSQHDTLTLTQALQQIADWNSHTTEYAVDYGSNGVRDFYRNIARAALSAAQPVQAQQAGEPVAWRWRNRVGDWVTVWLDYKPYQRACIEQQVAEAGGIIQYAYATTPPSPAQPVRQMLEGWKLVDNKDGSITVSTPAGGVVTLWRKGQGSTESIAYRLAQMLLTASPTPPAQQPAGDVVRDAERYRFLAERCRSASEHWEGRWCIVIDGPAPKSHDSEDDFDAAIDAAIAASGRQS